MRTEEQKLDDILRRLDKLDTHIINMIVPFNKIQPLIDLFSKPLTIDDRKLTGLLAGFRMSIMELIQAIKMEDLSKLKDELNPIIEMGRSLSRTMGEIKFIGKRLFEIEEKLKEISEKPFRKEVELSFRCEGYELVRKPNNYIKEQEKQPLSDDDNLKRLLDSLTERERKVLIHRIGLLGEKNKTFVAIGKIFGLTGSRIREIYLKSLRRLRHPSRKKMFDEISEKRLRDVVLGTDE